MKLALAFALFAFAACDRRSSTVEASPLEKPAAAGFVLSELKPAQGELPSLLAAEAAKAKAKGLKPFLEVSATWCGPCRKLKSSLSDPVMTEAFRGTYIVTVDLDEWETALSRAGYPVKVVPIFFKMGEGGKPTGKSLDGGAWSEDTPSQMAPPLKRFFNS
jgi:thiol-disulfide isomerase/thioredoxin